MKEYPVQRAAVLKPKPDPDTLVFGKTFTDHMFIMDYTAGQGWHDGRIVPYGPLALEPSAMVLHYAQEVFEGLKAYRGPDGGVQLFRPMENVRRINSSCERMCIPPLPEEDALAAIEQLVRLEAGWVPSKPGTSLYIRPFIIATTPSLGVHAAHDYLFCIITCPVGAYYAEGINPVKIYVENGYAQVLWLDGVHRKYIEEVGSMNVMFQVGDTVLTPELTGSVLPGITRKSCLELLKSWGLKVEERLITAQELFDAGADGTLKEAWGTGTAAVISPIGEMGWEDQHVVVNGGKIGPLAQRLYDTLTGIQWGTRPDPFGWVVKL